MSNLHFFIIIFLLLTSTLTKWQINFSKLNSVITKHYFRKTVIRKGLSQSLWLIGLRRQWTYPITSDRLFAICVLTHFRRSTWGQHIFNPPLPTHQPTLIPTHPYPLPTAPLDPSSSPHLPHICYVCYVCSANELRTHGPILCTLHAAVLPAGYIALKLSKRLCVLVVYFTLWYILQ